MENITKIKVGISLGDPNGIGPEIILKTFRDSRMLDFCTPVIFANTKLMAHYKRELAINCNLLQIPGPGAAHPKNINVMDVWKEHLAINYGEEDATAGTYAVQSFTAAVSALKENKIEALVTAPINKYSVQSDTFSFPGHTEYLNEQLEGHALMLMLSGSLRVGLLTGHVPIKEVPAKIDRERIDKKIKTIHQSLVQDFGIRKPRIAVLGINPHNGDKGVIGKEEGTVLKPALDNIRNNGKLVFGPYAADSFFGSGNYKNFDAVLASYHDQGLTPFKTLSFGKGVNFTAGLSGVRTSPDHGTAFDIAGKNKADPSSFSEAVFTAISIYKNRRAHQQMASNPLQPQSQRPYGKK